MGNYEGKVVIVTGAGGRGHFCRRVAERFAEVGATVVLAEIEEDAGKEVEAKLLAENLKAKFIPCDITNEIQVNSLIEQTVEEYGRIDVLVNAAYAYCEQGDLITASTEQWDRSMEVNLRGHYLCCRAAIPHLLKQPHSAIVNISSTGALYSESSSAGFAAAGAALSSLSRSIAVQFGNKGLRCNTLIHGFVTNPEYAYVAESDPMVAKIYEVSDAQIPLPGHGTNQQVADVAVFLASEDAGFITGQDIIADGGASSHSPTWFGFKQLFGG